MKASNLIAELQILVDRYGDLPVNYGSNCDDKTVAEVILYNERGNSPDKENDAVEIFLF